MSTIRLPAKFDTPPLKPDGGRPNQEDMRVTRPPIAPDNVRDERSAPQAPAAASPAGEHVVVARSAQALAQRAEQDRAARAERIAAVREALSSGRYKVDLDRLAERFVDEEMVGRSTR